MLWKCIWNNCCWCFQSLTENLCSFYDRQLKSCQVCASLVKTLCGGCILKPFFFFSRMPLTWKMLLWPSNMWDEIPCKVLLIFKVNIQPAQTYWVLSIDSFLSSIEPFNLVFITLTIPYIYSLYLNICHFLHKILHRNIIHTRSQMRILFSYAINTEQVKAQSITLCTN